MNFVLYELYHNKAITKKYYYKVLISFVRKVKILVDSRCWYVNIGRITIEKTITEIVCINFLTSKGTIQWKKNPINHQEGWKKENKRQNAPTWSFQLVSKGGNPNDIWQSQICWKAGSYVDVSDEWRLTSYSTPFITRVPGERNPHITPRLAKQIPPWNETFFLWSPVTKMILPISWGL